MVCCIWTLARFQHSRVKSHFSGCGRSVPGTLDDIRQGRMLFTDLPPIQVIIGDVNEEGGVWYYSLNNRRLWVIKQLKKEGLVERVGTRARRFRGKEPRRYCVEKCVLEANLMGGNHVSKEDVGEVVKGGDASGDKQTKGGDVGCGYESGGIDGVEDAGVGLAGEVKCDGDDNEGGEEATGGIVDSREVDGETCFDDPDDGEAVPVNGFAAFHFDDSSSEEETEEERLRKIEKAKKQAAKRRRQKEDKRRQKAALEAKASVDETES